MIRTCRVHLSGVTRDHPPFFQADCPQCEEKRAAGKVRGDEGMPAANWRRSKWRKHSYIDHERNKRLGKRNPNPFGGAF